MQYIWKLTKLLPQFVSVLNLDRLLCEIQHCFVVYSKHQLLSAEPMHTVKTILFQLIECVGEEVRREGSSVSGLGLTA